MKTHKASTTVVIVGAILLILGVITASVGLALGGASAIDFSSWRFSLGGCVSNRWIERESFDLTSQHPVQQLVLDIGMGDIDIILPDGRIPDEGERGDVYGTCRVEVSNYPKDFLHITEQNGMIQIIDNQREDWFSWGSWGNPAPKITVYLSSLELVALTVNNGAGDISVTGGPQFIVRQDALFDVGAGKLTIEADMIFESTCHITVGAGDAFIESATVKDLKLNVGAGQATFNGGVLRSAAVEVGAGDLNMALGGSASDYYITGTVGIGEVNIFGNHVGGTGQNLYGSPSAPVRITLDCGVGSIRITRQY